MNKRITITASHGDRLTITIGKKIITFNSYCDGNGFNVSMLKEDLEKELKNEI
jgi:hypothetical protein